MHKFLALKSARKFREQGTYLGVLREAEREHGQHADRPGGFTREAIQGALFDAALAVEFERWNM